MFFASEGGSCHRGFTIVLTLGVPPSDLGTSGESYFAVVSYESGCWRP